MPNATVGANARTLPEGTNRRAVLGAVLAAGAAVATALPAAAAASVARSHHPDADLFALIDRAGTVDTLLNKACKAADDILRKHRPSWPQALIWTEADVPCWHRATPGERISDHEIDFQRRWLTLVTPPNPIIVEEWTMFPTFAFIDRAREIVRTKDEYKAAWQAAKEHPDALEAEARSEALIDRWSEFAMRIATTPAKTPEGLVAKLALVAPVLADEEPEGTYDGILASAALDAQALANTKRGEAPT